MKVLAPFEFMLCRMAPMGQASFFRDAVFHRSASRDGVLVLAEVNVSGGEVVQALVLAAVIVVLDESLEETTASR